jgi:hypothetical protein
LNGKSASSNTTTTTIDPQKAVEKFVACLREQGLEVADPKVASDGQVDMRSIFQSANIQPGSTEFSTAMDKCGSLLQNAGFGPTAEERQARQEATLAFTACLRKQGLTVSDPTFNGPGDGQGGPPPGAAPGASGATGDSSASTTVAGDAASATTMPAPPAGGPPATEEERNARMAERLGLDAADPAVTAAFAACSTELAATRPNRGATTTTTTAS